VDGNPGKIQRQPDLRMDGAEAPGTAKTPDKSPEELADEILSTEKKDELRSKLIKVLEENRDLKAKLERWERDADEEFVIDNAGDEDAVDVPAYEKSSIKEALSNNAEEQTGGDKTEAKSNGPPRNCCFNCRGEHMISECPVPKDMNRIRQNKREFASKATPYSARYHVDDNQRYGHLKPGLPSRRLRKALGLRDERYLPSYIYRMRELGYPPAWLKHARIDHSGLSLYMDKGRVLSASEVTNGEEGEVDDVLNQIEFDTSKLQEWPGFNVKPPKGTKEEGNNYRAPPIQEHQSLTLMKERMQHFEQKAYVRGEMQHTNVAKSDDDDDVTGTEKEEEKTESMTSQQHTPFEKVGESPMVAKSKAVGTPICSLYSPYQSLPDAAKWMTNTTDHIFFENLPEATGKYEKMAELLKKARKTRANIEKVAAAEAAAKKNNRNLTPAAATAAASSRPDVEVLSSDSSKQQSDVEILSSADSKSQQSDDVEILSPESPPP